MARSLRTALGAALAAAAIASAHAPAESQQRPHAAPPPAPAAAEKFVLSGVVVLDGGKGLAWIQEPTLTGNQVVPLRPGDVLGPYRLSKILEDRVELEGPAGTVQVPVYGSAGGPATAVAASPSARESAPVAMPAARSDVQPAALTPRESRMEMDRLRDLKQTIRRDNRQSPPAAANAPAADDNSNGRRRGSKRGQGKGDGSNATAGAETSGGGSGGSMTISRGDSRRSGFQNMTRSAPAN